MQITLELAGVDAGAILQGGKHVLIDVKETREGCILAIEPVVKIIDGIPKNMVIACDVLVLMNGTNVQFHVSQNFVSYYPTIETVSLEGRQRLRSRYLSIQSPKPLLIRTCQTNGAQK